MQHAGKEIIKRVMIFLWLLTSCATPTKQTDDLLKQSGPFPDSHKITNVPFIPQKQNNFGPSSLAMVMEYYGIKTDVNELIFQMFTPLEEGKYRTDLITSVHRQGLTAIPVNNLTAMLTEISRGHPLLVLQNLGTSTMLHWHYSVAVGYDINGPDIILHSGEDEFKKVDLRLFEKSWSLAEHWGLIILPPSVLSATGTELDHLQSASALEQLGNIMEAEEAYNAILLKWSKSLGALVGMGNVLYQSGKYDESVNYLDRATELYPLSAVAWHNLAVAQGAAGQRKKAEESSQKAISLVDEANAAYFHESLKSWLK